MFSNFERAAISVLSLSPCVGYELRIACVVRCSELQLCCQCSSSGHHVFDYMDFPTAVSKFPPCGTSFALEPLPSPNTECESLSHAPIPFPCAQSTSPRPHTPHLLDPNTTCRSRSCFPACAHHPPQVDHTWLLDDGSSRSSKAKKMGGKAKASGPYSSSALSSKDSCLFSLGVRLELTGVSGEDDNDSDTRRLRGNDLVSLRSPMWTSSDVSFLGVVQSWDPVYKHTRGVVKIIVCANPSGGDGAGGRGGWLPLRDIQQGVGKGKRGGGTPITICRCGTLTTACREYQAVMSLSELPASTRRFLLDPGVTKEVKPSPPTPRAKPPAMVVRSPSFSVTLGSGGRGGSAGAVVMDEDEAPPPNVPVRLWEAVVRSFNRSQARAIRKVAEGSPSGFTLLQVGSWILILRCHFLLEEESATRKEGTYSRLRLRRYAIKERLHLYLIYREGCLRWKDK